jgi:DNA-binding GntR family transcriptional regulator
MAGVTSHDKLVSRIVEKIHAKIALGDYAPGERLRQELLAEEFKVSRTPIREALRLLEAKGVISQEHRHSAVIRVPTAREVRETYQVRAELEGLAAELAAQWITDEEIKELRAVHEIFIQSVKDLGILRNSPKRNERAMIKTSTEWIEANGKFHLLIQLASKNLRLQQMISELYAGFTRNVMYASSRAMDAHRMQKNIADHEQVLHWLEKRVASEARAAMQSHVLQSGTFMISWLENQLEGHAKR